jgi:hypothetical protein
MKLVRESLFEKKENDAYHNSIEYPDIEEKSFIKKWFNKLRKYGVKPNYTVDKNLNIFIGNDLDLSKVPSSEITEFPNNLHVIGNIDLQGCELLDKLPGNLYVTGNIDLRGCKLLDKLPDNWYANDIIYEKFTEEGDAIYDMGIGLLPKYREELEKRYRWESYEPKDRMRVEDIISKSKGDSKKEISLATTMGKLIQDPKKAYRRYRAAAKIGGEHWDVTRVFLQRAGELAKIK